MDNVKLLPDNGNILNNFCLTDSVNNTTDNVNNITNVKLVTVSEDGVHAESNFTYTSNTNVKPLSSSSSASSVIKINPNMVENEAIDKKVASNLVTSRNGSNLNENFVGDISGKKEIPNQQIKLDKNSSDQQSSEAASVSTGSKDENTNLVPEKEPSPVVQAVKDKEKNEISSIVDCPKSENGSDIKEDVQANSDKDSDQICKNTQSLDKSPTLKQKDSMETTGHAIQSDNFPNKLEVQTKDALKTMEETQSQINGSPKIDKDIQSKVDEASKTEAVQPNVNDASPKLNEPEPKVDETSEKSGDVPSQNGESSKLDEPSGKPVKIEPKVEETQNTKALTEASEPLKMNENKNNLVKTENIEPLCKTEDKGEEPAAKAEGSAEKQDKCEESAAKTEVIAENKSEDLTTKTEETAGNKSKNEELTAEIESIAENKDKSEEPAAKAERTDENKDTSEESKAKTEGTEATDAKSCTEETNEREPVVEEEILKKDSPGTGFDDKIIDDWKKVEEKKEAENKEEEKKEDPKKVKDKKESTSSAAIEAEICPKDEKGTDTFDSFMDEVITGYEKGATKKDRKRLNKEKKKEKRVKTEKKEMKEETLLKSELKESEASQKSCEPEITKSAKNETETSPEKKRTAKLKKEDELKEQHKQIVQAVRKLLPEEGHDSGVDETTQSKDGASKSPPKNGRISPKKRQPRSVDPSPMKRTPQSTASIERKLPMNKVEVGKSASPNIKNVRSKIGSLDNATYRPGGGKIKIESKKLDFSKASSKIAAKNDAYAPGGGDKKIESQKLKWNANSKIGSLDNKLHKPGGGDKKVETQKLHFKEKAQAKIGSKDNLKHKAGGGDVEIPVEKVEFREKASSKIGSLDNVKHKPKGGDKKIFDDKDYLRQVQSSGNPSPCKTPTSKTSSGRESGAISPATTGTNSPGPQEE